MVQFSASRIRFLLGSSIFVFIIVLLWQSSPSTTSRSPAWWNAFQAEKGSQTFTTSPQQQNGTIRPQGPDSATSQLLKSISTTSKYFLDYPLPPSEFGEMGKRLQVLRGWINANQTLSGKISIYEANVLNHQIDHTALSMFPFLRNPVDADAHDTHVLSTLRQSFRPGYKGIVIPTGTGTFRYACHLVSNIRDVLHSKLPIEIVYAGEKDLPLEYRDFVTSLGSDIHTTDILKALDDTTLDLANGGWAVKSFAALASSFEQVIVLDADAVLVQAPEVIFNNHKGYHETGALFFHDRLLWQGSFPDRHRWWEAQLKHHEPSKTLQKSRVYNEGYAEECDSGIVVVDKGRLSILLGLLHVCWQNSKIVRDEWTYKMGFGDKESWWFGMELSGAEYTFEKHYGGIIGEIKVQDGKTKVCSFSIAHTDEDDKLLWYNGSLLKNKLANTTEYDIPTSWMLDGVWEKGASKPEISCMRDETARDTTEIERDILSGSVENAKKIDTRIQAFTTI